MCIRDRFYKDGHKKTIINKKSSRSYLELISQPRFLQALICLLYTSDAADEEDSVDLGGRRIIKKTKHIVSRTRITYLYY